MCYLPKQYVVNLNTIECITLRIYEVHENITFDNNNYFRVNTLDNFDDCFKFWYFCYTTREMIFKT